MALDQADLSTIGSAIQAALMQLGPLTASGPSEIASQALLPGGIQPQTPFRVASQGEETGPKTFGPFIKPPGYNNLIVSLFNPAGTVNIKVLDGPAAPINTATDTAAVQTAIANVNFQVDGIQNVFSIQVTSVSASGKYQLSYSFTNATRPSGAIDLTTAAQGSPNASVSNGWPVKVTDGTSVASIDNSAALEVSQYAKGSGVAGDTAVRLATQIVNLAAVPITTGTPVSEYTPASAKKFVLMEADISVNLACSVKFEDGTGVEVARTPQLQPNTPYHLAFGNGKKSGTVNTSLFLDTSAAAGQVVTVNGVLKLAGDEA